MADVEYGGVVSSLLPYILVKYDLENGCGERMWRSTPTNEPQFGSYDLLGIRIWRQGRVAGNANKLSFYPKWDLQTTISLHLKPRIVETLVARSNS